MTTPDTLTFWPDLGETQPAILFRELPPRLESRTMKLGLASAFGLAVLAFPTPLESFLSAPGNEWATPVWRVAFVAFWSGIALTAGVLSFRTFGYVVTARAARAHTLAAGASLMLDFDLSDIDAAWDDMAAILQLRPLTIVVEEAAVRSHNAAARTMLRTTAESLRLMDEATRKQARGSRRVLLPSSHASHPETGHSLPN